MSINEGVFSSSFVLSENNKRVALNNQSSTAQQNFFVKEKGRKIEVKKFGVESDITDINDDVILLDSLSNDSLSVDEQSSDVAPIDSLSELDRLAVQSMARLDSIVIDAVASNEYVDETEELTEDELLLQEQLVLQEIVDSLSRVLDVDEAQELQDFFNNENQ